ncbi:MAG: preprotein translocase subunit YajC [Gemmatimonadota bacterium]|nr:preprotein translocase subunit YajC [Gemmatimonadota bacterium]
MVLMSQLVLIVGIFYFLLIRPQRKERQRHQEMLGKLSRGDQVMTNGGILGVIIHATDRALTIRTGENTRIVVDRGHIARKIEAE